MSDVTLTEVEVATLVKALHDAETTGGFWGEHPECQEFADVVKPAVEAIVAARVAEAWNEAERAVERQTNLAELVYFDKPSDFRKGVLSSLTAVKAARAAALRAEGGS